MGALAVVVGAILLACALAPCIPAPDDVAEMVKRWIRQQKEARRE